MSTDIWPSSQETLPLEFATRLYSNPSAQLHRLDRVLKYWMGQHVNNKGTAPIIFIFMESIITKRAICKTSILQQVPVPEKTPKTGFLATRPKHLIHCCYFTLKQNAIISNNNDADQTVRMRKSVSLL